MHFYPSCHDLSPFKPTFPYSYTPSIPSKPIRLAPLYPSSHPPSHTHFQTHISAFPISVTPFSLSNHNYTHFLLSHTIFHCPHTHSLNPLNPFHVYLRTHSTLLLTRLIRTYYTIHTHLIYPAGTTLISSSCISAKLKKCGSDIWPLC